MSRWGGRAGARRSQGVSRRSQGVSRRSQGVSPAASGCERGGGLVEELRGTHDLRLPSWGPYTKAYMGISHIPDPALGLRFDLSIVPGFYRGSVQVPNVKWESGYHPWEASPDLRYYAYRHELQWKDEVYVDVSFSEVDERSRLVRCVCVNNTDLPVALALHYVASVHFPPLRPNSDEPIRPGKAVLPHGAVWVDALDYVDLQYATPRPTDNLMPDSRLRGQIRDHGFVGGGGVGDGWGAEAGDSVRYQVHLPTSLRDGVLLLRCRMVEGDSLRLELQGLVRADVAVTVGEDLAEMALPIGAATAGTHWVEILSGGGASIELDGFAICESSEVAEVAFGTVTWHPVPDLAPGPRTGTLRLSYQDVPVRYGLAWDGAFRSQVRKLYTDDLDCFMRRTVHDHVRTVLHDRWAPGPPQCHFTDVFLRPVTVDAHSRVTTYGLVCCGSAQQVEEALEEWDGCADGCQETYEQACTSAVKLDGHEAGQRYRASQERMAATTLTNVVYPVCIKRTYIRHNTPGRWWDSLYTWDSGFIGLGLVELDVDRATDCLNAYVTEPGDPHAAFVHHGSPVPVQFYLFLEIWNRRQERALLERFYPRLRQYYAFLSGQLGSSTTRALESSLLKTWDYFYNSGGWDDYPPQVYVHQNGLESKVAPVVTTAHCIRAARILGMMAQALGRSEDLAGYERDIVPFELALQEHAWDSQSGYFSYVVHDDAGRPVGHLRHESGTNYNRGLDGIYPLVAGVCTPGQEECLFAHLESPRQHWTPIGLSTVDTSAPYYREDGYWNGAVWMPHQWFYWKTCLDLGRPGFARQIAETGLEVWQREVDASYNCYEHFIIATGRGAGWHQFGGLSTPVLSWYGAYYRPGRLTTGFDVWARSLRWGTNAGSLDAELVTHGQSGRRLCVIVSLAAARHYGVTWNGEPCPACSVRSGVLEVELPCGQEGRLQVAPVD
jgi:hypothetical protein